MFQSLRTIQNPNNKYLIMLFFCVKEEYRQRLLCITRTCLLGNPQKNSLIQISLIISHHLFKPLLQKVWNLHYKWMLLLAKMLCRRQKRRKTSENREQFKWFLTILLTKNLLSYSKFVFSKYHLRSVNFHTIKFNSIIT